MNAENKNLAHRWIAAFNEHDLQKLLALYHADAVHHSPKLQLRLPETMGKIRGKEALRNWWADAFERLPSLRYELKNMIINEQQVFMEYERTVDGESPMMVAEVLEIEEGMIIRSRVYHG